MGQISGKIFNDILVKPQDNGSAPRQGIPPSAFQGWQILYILRDLVLLRLAIIPD
jgi:hypothetical protein